jgi:hypothetical protein
MQAYAGLLDPFSPHVFLCSSSNIKASQKKRSRLLFVFASVEFLAKDLITTLNTHNQRNPRTQVRCSVIARAVSGP